MVTPPRLVALVLLLLSAFAPRPVRADDGDAPARGPALPYPIVDTGQERCYDAHREIPPPAPGAAFPGQDACTVGHEPRYEDLGDGTVRDLVTGLVWEQGPGPKRTYAEAVAGAARCRTGGHRDWRLPTLKELYSLVLFSGLDVDPQGAASADMQAFLDARVFAFAYGSPDRGERLIDAQWVSATRSVSPTMHGEETVFGVNFADGRIKGYGLRMSGARGEKTFRVRYVRGNPRYGRNDFLDNGDGAVSDRATGLTWMKRDSGHLRAGPRGDGRMTWGEALAWADGLDHAGHDDWRLPDAKELQSIVDYTRSPDATNSPAVDPVFETSSIRGEGGAKDYPYFWTSTTHASLRDASAAVYVAFGRALGWMRPPGRGGDAALLDVHGAGSQRSDPKEGDPAAYPRGRGPQGDVIRILNHVRCVRGGKATPRRRWPALRAAGAGPTRPGPGAEPRGGGAAFVARLDADGDGRVSRAEFDGPPDHFRDFDRDGDGFIDADEAPSGPPPGGPAPGRRPPR